jgi:hypothetical protein
MHNLHAKSLQAALLLASGKKGTDTAAEVGVTPETISHWKQEAEFVACVNTLKLEAIEVARERLRHLGLKATETMEELMRHGKSESVRLRAAEAVLKHAGVSDAKLFGSGIGPTSIVRVENDLLNKKMYG